MNQSVEIQLLVEGNAEIAFQILEKLAIFLRENNANFVKAIVSDDDY